MNKLRRIFNQNRKTIFSVIIILIVSFALLRLVNHLVKIQNEENMKKNVNQPITYDRAYEIISGERKETDTYNKEHSVIENFLEYCNNKEFEKAYDMLTQECKDAIYPSLETFISEYGEEIFSTKRDYNIQAWTSSIYRIRITDNLLETGSTGNKNFVEDYFSIIGNKLNINSFLDTIKMNKPKEQANVTITIEQLNIYMDYSVIKMNISNKRDTSIMLNSEDYADNVYLKDDKDLKFVAMLHELSQDEFIIGAGENKQVSIKFDVPYSKINDIESFNMDNIIANYEQYKELGDSRAIQITIPL